MSHFCCKDNSVNKCISRFLLTHTRARLYKYISSLFFIISYSLLETVLQTVLAVRCVGSESLDFKGFERGLCCVEVCVKNCVIFRLCVLQSVLVQCVNVCVSCVLCRL